MNGTYLLIFTCFVSLFLKGNYVNAQSPDFLWAKQASGIISNISENGRAVTKDGSGNIYVTGSFSGTATFGSITHTSRGSQDLFLIKYDTAGNVLWARSAGGTGNDVGNGVAVDDLGNSYVTGSFVGTATFGSKTITSSGTEDIFLAKYDASGNVLWVLGAGGALNDGGYAVAVDGSGNSYLTGHFTGTASLGSIALTSSGANDIFLAKYDASGNVLWAHCTGGPFSDVGQGVALDNSGNIYVTGSHGGTSSFGSFKLTSAGNRDIFLVKYDASGSVLWAQSAGGALNDIGFGVAVDGLGNSYVTGQFSSTATFGSVTLTSSGGFDMFLTKYDAMGNVFWAQAAGGASSDIGYGVAVDSFGNSYVTGSFESTTLFGNMTLSPAGGQDMFLAKYDGSGNIIWTRSAGGSLNDAGSGVAVDGQGNSYVTGSFSGVTTFESVTLSSLGGSDMFASKYDASGNLSWANKVSALDTNDLGTSVAVDGSGNSYVIGTFQGTVTFGNITLTSTGRRDIFLVKYDNLGNVLWARMDGGPFTDFAQGLAVDDLGNSYVTGSFEGNASFGNVTLTSVGGGDIFTAKYDNSGNLLWAHSLASGNNALDVSYGVAVDGSGNSYATGFFSGTANFGNTTLTSAGGRDMFLVKYDSSGNILWVRTAGGLGSNDIGFGVALDGIGNSYVTGQFSGTATFGSTTLRSTEGLNMFLVKFDASGNVLWVRSWGGTGGNWGHCLAVDGSGNSYVIGSFQGTATIEDATYASAGGLDVFLAKYDGSGNVLWARSAGGSLDDAGIGVAVDGSGNSYVTGSFSGAATFGSSILSCLGGSDMFASKYDASGNLLWTLSAGGSLDDAGNAIVVDGTGSSYVTGHFSGMAAFGNTTLSTNGQEVFVTKIGAGPAGFDESYLAASSSLFPNPTTGKLLLVLPQVKSRYVQVSLLNSKGQVLSRKIHSSVSGEFRKIMDLENRAAGIYLVQVVTDEWTITKRVIKH